MSTVNMIDKNGIEIEMGEHVNMPSPNENDIWSNEFTGSIIGVDEENELITVADQDGECYSVESNRVEIA